MATDSKSKLNDYSTYNLLKDLAPYFKPYRAQLIGSTLLRIIGDIAWLYPAYALATIVNFLTTYHAGDSTAPMVQVLFLFLASIIVRHVTGYCAKMLMFRNSERIGLDVQLSSIGHLFNLDIAWHEHENSGNKLKKINRGADSVDRILRIWINNIIEIIINFIGITIVIARFDHVIALITFAFLCTYYVASRILRKKAAEASIRSNAQEEEVEGLLFESINNIRTVKVLGMAPILGKRIAEASDDLYAKIKKRVFWFQTGGYGRAAYARTFQLAMLALIVYGILHGRYEVGFLVLFFTYFGKLVDAVSELADVAQDYVVAKLSIGRLFEILHEPVRIDQEAGKVAFPSDWKTISFKNVSFSYGDNQVLENITFDIKRGEKIGIVGLSGAGKSTLFKLMLKEYESYSGEILIDDVPLSSIRRQNYFRYTAVVLQDTEVFNFSLKDNIGLANMEDRPDQSLFDKAIRVAHVDDFISRLPQGIESLIGEKGIRLSGGERQRLGIARAVFKNPQLLLMDEATSHLDVESEGKIQASLHEFFNSVTAVVIAHRLTTIKEMDRIIVVEGGRILEQGSFAQLRRMKGRFHELWEKQSL